MGCSGAGRMSYSFLGIEWSMYHWYTNGKRPAVISMSLGNEGSVAGSYYGQALRNVRRAGAAQPQPAAQAQARRHAGAQARRRATHETGTLRKRRHQLWWQAHRRAQRVEASLTCASVPRTASATRSCCPQGPCESASVPASLSAARGSPTSRPTRASHAPRRARCSAQVPCPARVGGEGLSSDRRAQGAAGGWSLCIVC